MIAGRDAHRCQAVFGVDAQLQPVLLFRDQAAQTAQAFQPVSDVARLRLL